MPIRVYNYCPSGGDACSNNNGNLQSQIITRPNGSWSQTYGYDGVNRLSSVAESGSGVWSEGYLYDAFGNRWMCTRSQNCNRGVPPSTDPGVPFRTGLPDLTGQTPTGQSCYQWTNGVKNRISTWGYDQAGNVLSISGMANNFTYDGENRQVTASVARGRE